MKGKAGHLPAAVRAAHAHARARDAGLAGGGTFAEVAAGHGRYAERHPVVLPAPAGFDLGWPAALAVVSVARGQGAGEAVSSRRAFFPTSAAGAAADYAARVRSHWAAAAGVTGCRTWRSAAPERGPPSRPAGAAGRVQARRMRAG